MHRFWEENGTAYMVMPYYQGPTLHRAVSEKQIPTDEASLRQLLSPLLDALAALHRERCFHRDISPDNILLTPTGPVLLDFGAARLAIGDASQSFTVILKEGYAPVEQYASEEAVAMKQGPWTDIYALSGVMRYAITGKKPPSAVVRMAARIDPMEPLVQIAAGRCSAPFLRALDTGMAIHAEERPQSIEQFRALLGDAANSGQGVTLLRPAPPRDDGAAPGVLAPSSPADPAKNGTPAEHTGPVAPPSERVRMYGDAPVRPAALRWALGLLLPLILACAFAAYRILLLRSPILPSEQSSPAVARAAPPARSNPVTGAPVPSSGPPQTHRLPPREVPAVAAASPPQRSHPLAPTPSAQSRSSGDEHPAASAAPEEHSAAPFAQVASDDHRPFLGPGHDRHGDRPLNAALVLMLRAARSNAWRALDRRAAFISRTADPVLPGDRGASRKANQLGLAALRQHRIREAVTAFEVGLAADPSDIEVANNYGYALALAGRRAQAQRALTAVLLRDPTRSVAWTALAEARSGDRATAIAALKIALHFATSRERTLESFWEMAQNHPDPRVRRIVRAVLAQSDRVPTVRQGLP